MFRRKDELDMDGEFGDGQGSLLNADSVEVTDNTVKVLTPEKAAQYQAERGGAAPEPAKPAAPAVSKPQAQKASFSSPSSYGQSARPIQTPTPAPVAVEAPRPAPASMTASNSNQSARVSPALPSQSAPRSTAPASTADSARFRPQSDASRPATPSVPSAPSSNYNSESPAMLNKHNQNERILTVGNDILLKGEITACDRLIIEGNVDATVSEVQTMELSEAGSFKGMAEVEFAEISGDFQGNLIVQGSLLIHRTGRVSGNITYGEIEIARGGSITGDIKAIDTGSSASVSTTKQAAKEAA